MISEYWNYLQQLLTWCVNIKEKTVLLTRCRWLYTDVAKFEGVSSNFCVGLELYWSLKERKWLALIILHGILDCVQDNTGAYMHMQFCYFRMFYYIKLNLIFNWLAKFFRFNNRLYFSLKTVNLFLIKIGAKSRAGAGHLMLTYHHFVLPKASIPSTPALPSY